MPKNCLIVPCFNEAARLRIEPFREFLLQQSEIDILFVNDGSQDGTANMLATVCDLVPGRVRCLNLPKNVGKAEAIRTGVLELSGQGYQWVGYCDADLATSLEEMASLLESTDRHEQHRFVFGSRWSRLGCQIERELVRHWLGRCFATFTSLVLRLPTYDTQCGAKWFHSSTLEVLFQQPLTSRWLFDVELFARFRNHYGRGAALEQILELPLKSWKEVRGSKLRGKDFFIFPVDLVRIQRRYNWKSNND